MDLNELTETGSCTPCTNAYPSPCIENVGLPTDGHQSNYHFCSGQVCEVFNIFDPLYKFQVHRHIPLI